MDESRITWRAKDGRLELLVDGRPACTSVLPEMAPPDSDTPYPVEVVEPWSFSANCATQTLQCGPWRVEEVVERVEEEGAPAFRWTRTYRNFEAVPAATRVVLEWDAPPPVFTLLPGVSYDGNPWGRGNEPKGLMRDGKPWVFAAHRMSVPAGSYSENAHGSVFVFADVGGLAAGCSGSLAPQAAGIRHRLIWPEEESPVCYSARDQYSPACRVPLQLAPGEPLEAVGWVVITPAERARTAWRHGLDAAWTRFHNEPAAWFGPEEIWSLAVRYAHESLWEDNAEYTGFYIGLRRRADGGAGWEKRPSQRYELGWCGQNAAFGRAMLADYLRTGNELSRERGRRTLDFWAEQARLPNGLFWTLFDDKLEGTPEPRLDTCNLAHGAYQFMAAADLAEPCGFSRPQWRDAGIAVCDFFVEHVLPDGTFGSAWSPEGASIDTTGTTGAFLMWSLLRAHRQTGNEKYLRCAQRAFEVYVTRDLDYARCGGGALDTHCVDKESAFPLVQAALDLFELTQDPSYLKSAEDAGYYLASWQWHYRAPFPPDSAMGRMGYDTCGGTSVSAGHHHQDPWGALLALVWMRLARATGRTIWRERARSAWNQATIGISDGTLDVYGVRRPAGSQDEGFFHTHWTAGRPGTGRGDTTEWLVAWPSAFRLITLMEWTDWEDLR